MEREIYNKNAVHFPGLLVGAEDYIEFCLNKSNLTSTPWQPWLSGGDEIPHQYGELWTINSSGPEEDKLLDRYDEAVLTSLREFLGHVGCSTSTTTAIMSKISTNRPRALAVKRYFEGEELGPHPDADPGQTTPELPITISMYFNDGYEGGNLGFEDGSEIKLTSGSVVVFPATYFHTSTKVTSGVKYVSNEVIFINKKDLEVEVI